MDRFFPLTEGSLHTLQNLSPFLLEEDKEELVIQCTAKLMTCDSMELSKIDGQSLIFFFSTAKLNFRGRTFNAYI